MGRGWRGRTGRENRGKEVDEGEKVGEDIYIGAKPKSRKEHLKKNEGDTG